MIDEARIETEATELLRTLIRNACVNTGEAASGHEERSDLVVLDQAIDTTTPSGRLLFQVLAAIAEFERDLIRERVVAGLRRASRAGSVARHPW